MTRLAVVLAFGALALPGLALADADPASDTLYTGRVFLPLSVKVAPRLARELDQATLQAQRAGRPVRVALIAKPTDLGGVPQLFGKPATYARFLAGELQYVYPDKVLIVMPQGAALGDHGRLAANSDVLHAKVGPGPDRLAVTAIELVRTISGAGRARDEASGISIWVWVAIGVAVIGLLGAGLALARRS